MDRIFSEVGAFKKNEVIIIFCSVLKVCKYFQTCRSAMIFEMMEDIKNHLDTVPAEHATCLLMGTKRKAYQKLLDRPKCGNFYK